MSLPTELNQLRQSVSFCALSMVLLSCLPSPFCPCPRSAPWSISWKNAEALTGWRVVGSCPCRGVVHEDCDTLTSRSVAGQSLTGGGRGAETESGLPLLRTCLCWARQPLWAPSSSHRPTSFLSSLLLRAVMRIRWVHWWESFQIKHFK